MSFRVALMLMTGSLFLCAKVGSEEELRGVPFGLPIPFVALDARESRPAAYPACLHLANPRDGSVRLRPLPALADLVLLTLGLTLAARAFGVGWTGRPDGPARKGGSGPAGSGGAGGADG